jgi:hypothetical protein
MARTVKIVGDKVLFELSGADEFFATKRSVSVRPERVVSVSTDRKGGVGVVLAT